MTGSVRSLSQAPRRVSMPLIMPPQLGAQSATLNTMPSDCAQSGNAVWSRWCGPAQMYMNTRDQKCTTESR